MSSGLQFCEMLIIRLSKYLDSYWAYNSQKKAPAITGAFFCEHIKRKGFIAMMRGASCHHFYLGFWLLLL